LLTKGNKRRKKGRIKVQTKRTTPKSAKLTTGSPNRRKQVTQDLNPSPVGSNWCKVCKVCKEMGKNPGREQASFMLPKNTFDQQVSKDYMYIITH
jgi:hypothetical protein